ncbi:MAG: hypothetical protein Q9161_005414 [Pseudevernia consocians]
MGLSEAASLAIESWTLYAIAILTVAARLKILLLGIFSLGVLVILCAILNRYYNFTGGFGDLEYLNWYAGETSTAVIVVNVPHLWPLISRILGLGAFKSSTAAIESKTRFNQSKVSAVSRSQAKEFDNSGYIRSESEERIANAGAWAGKGSDMEMGHVDADNVYATTVEAGRRRTQDEEEGVWGSNQNSRFVDGEGIVKTVHMNQFAE